MKWAKDWWFEVAELEILEKGVITGYVPEIGLRTKLYGKVLIVQITSKMGEGLVI